MQQEYLTDNQKDVAKRHERILTNFKKLREKYPTAAISRIAAMLTEYERGKADGIKTVPGITRILKKYGLWTPRQINNK